MMSRFRVNAPKHMTTLSENHFTLSKEQSPKTAEERDHMELVICSFDDLTNLGTS